MLRIPIYSFALSVLLLTTVSGCKYPFRLGPHKSAKDKHFRLHTQLGFGDTLNYTVPGYFEGKVKVTGGDTVVRYYMRIVNSGKVCMSTQKLEDIYRPSKLNYVGYYKILKDSACEFEMYDPLRKVFFTWKGGFSAKAIHITSYNARYSFIHIKKDLVLSRKNE